MYKRLPVALHLPRDAHARKNWARRPSDAVLPPTAKHLPHAARSSAAKLQEFRNRLMNSRLKRRRWYQNDAKC